MEKKVLFVCTGNTCRSSMAEGLAIAVAKEMGLQELDFASAGTLACPGDRATYQAVETLEEMGIEISRHQATLLTSELIQEADLVLTMTGSHRRQVLKLLPQSEAKVYTLGQYVGVPGDIPDPFGSPVEEYRRCAGELKSLIRLALQKLKDS